MWCLPAAALTASMAWTALPLLLLLAGASLTASSESMPTMPLSYVLADTAFLADEISSKDGESCRGL